MLGWVPLNPLGRPGSDLLSHTLRCSTIGAKGFHVRVRDGIGWDTLAITTRSSKRILGNRLRVKSGVDRASIFVCEKPLGLSVRMDGTFKSIEQLVPVSYTHYCASTPGLSTGWSSTALKGYLVLMGASRLDAFSGYPVRT